MSRQGANGQDDSLFRLGRTARPAQCRLHEVALPLVVEVGFRVYAVLT
jgi:hypothetical protein